MKYVDAQSEFRLRLYRWAKDALHEEIENEFSSFSLCKDGPAKACRFFRELDQRKRGQFAKGLLHRRHEEAATSLAEHLSTEAEIVLRQYDDFCLRHGSGYGDQLLELEVRGEKPCFAQRRKLRASITRLFHAKFGEICLPKDPLDGDRDLVFAISCRGWIIKTIFSFGRWYPEIDFTHSIWTGKWITSADPPVLFANSLGTGLGYGREIGIGSGWPYLIEEESEPACLAAIAHCERMLQDLNNLLSGLELESLTR